MNDVILIRASKAAQMLDVSTRRIYELAAGGQLGPRRFIGKGTREFRLEVSAVRAYAESLPTEPVEDP